MNRERILSVIVYTILSALLAMGSVGCLLTGFSLPLEYPLQAGCYLVLSALVLAAVYSRNRPFPALVALAAAWCWAMWRMEEPVEQMRQLIAAVCRTYGAAFHMTLPEFGGTSQGYDYCLLILGVPIAAAGARMVSGRHGCSLAVILSLLPVLACLVVADTPPAVHWVLLWLFSLLCMLSVSSVRRCSVRQGNRLLGLIVLPAALFCILLYCIIPEPEYSNNTEQIRIAIAQYFRRSGIAQEVTVQISDALPSHREQIDLLGMTGPPDQRIPILDVTSLRGGSIYLREQDYEEYTGIQWRNTAQRRETLMGGENETDTLTIRTFRIRPQRLTGYYPADGVTLENGGAPNTEGLMLYTVHCAEPRESELLQESLYLTLPETAIEFAAPIVRSLKTDTHQQTAAAIGEYVRNSALYDKQTPQMPKTEPDFVQWFLSDCDTGYCTHFAASAVVLLRAAGIPARYVTGYRVEALPNVQAMVTAADAHAWAEFYADGVWHVLEATPADPEAAEAPTASAEGTAPSMPTAPRETLPDSGELETTVSQNREETHSQTSNSTEEPSFQIPLLVLLLPVCLAGAAELQRLLRRWRLYAPAGQGQNAQALVLWHQCEREALRLKESPPKNLLHLAEKARYSPHRLTEAEQSQFTAYLKETASRRKQRGLLHRLADRYIYVLN